MHFHQIHPALPDWMSALETRLSGLLAQEWPVLRDAGMTVLGSRGKRLRPVLLLLSCACYGEVTERAITQGCLVELIHTASLVHDDVIDDADIRRGIPSARARWGNKFSILLGDYLLGRVFELAAEDGDPSVLRILSPTAAEMGRGVLRELTELTLEADETQYWQVVHGKTAVLFATACHLGALLGGADPAEQQTMRALGHAFGCAFQLADDLMDLQGSADETGKPLHMDWAQRCATLPVLYALRHASADSAAAIRTIWAEERYDAAQFASLLRLIEASGGFGYGWEKVKEYIAEAGTGLARVPAGPAREALQRLCSESFPLPVLPPAAYSL